MENKNKKVIMESRSHYNLRSSLKRNSRNPLGNLDASDECQDVTLAPPPRRVSFAASSTVKPFVNDPDKNTIWDNTYEEEVNNETDSHNVISLDYNTYIQESKSVSKKVDFNQSVVNLEATLYNSSDSMELTDCQTNNIVESKMLNEKVDMSLIGYRLNDMDKENHQLSMAHAIKSSQKKSLRAESIVKPLGQNSSMMKTIVEPLDMELTCQFNKQKVISNATSEESKVLGETHIANSTLYQEMDMSMTCKFTNQNRSKENTFPHSSGLANLNQTPVDMEFTCQFYPQMLVYSAPPPNDVAFTCFPKETVPKQIISCDKVGQDQNVTEFTTDMEFTCQFPNKAADPPRGAQVSEKVQNVTQFGADMEFTCQFPEGTLGSSRKAQETNIFETVQNATQSNTHMEFTCNFPQAVEAEKKAQFSNLKMSKKICCISTDSNVGNDECPQKISNLEQFPVEMELTRVFPQAIVELQNNHQITKPDSSFKVNMSTHPNVSSKVLPISTKIEFTSINNEISKLASTSLSNKDQSTLVERQTYIETTLNGIEKSLEAHLQAENALQQGPSNVKEFGGIPIAIDCIDHSMEDGIKDNCANKAASPFIQKETYVIPSITKENNYTASSIVVPDISNKQNILDVSRIKAAARSLKHTIYQYYDQSSQGNSLQKEEVAHNNVLRDEFKTPFSRIGKNETILDQECSLIDTLTSIPEDDLPDQLDPPKVIYSEHIKVAKPSNSMLDFSRGFSSTIQSSGKKPLCLSSMGSMDGTQQLIEATFSKHFQNSQSAKTEDNFIVDASFVMAQNILGNKPVRIVTYKPIEFDYEDFRRVKKEQKELQNKVKRYLENYQSPTPSLRKAILEKVRELSLANISSNTNVSSSLEDPEHEDKNATVEAPKTLHERIIEIISTTEDHILKLMHYEENYYICSTFSRAVGFAVWLHPEDGRVTDVKTVRNLKENSNSFWPEVYEFIVKHTINKLQMCNLRSSLGSTFDMLSLLDHVNIITEKNFEFCVEFMEAQRHCHSLTMGTDSTVSIQIFVINPIIWWTVQFKMTSVETLESDSLRVTSKLGKANVDHLKTILRNTGPGVDCIRRFILEVLTYFKRTQLLLATKLKNIKRVEEK